MRIYLALLVGVLLGAGLVAALTPRRPVEAPRWPGLHLARESVLDKLRRLPLGPPPRRRIG